MSIAALILGILAVVNSWYGYGVGLIMGIVAMVLGSKAMAKNPADGKAKAGKILGLIGIILSGVMTVVMIIACVACGGAALLSSY